MSNKAIISYLKFIAKIFELADYQNSDFKMITRVIKSLEKLKQTVSLKTFKIEALKSLGLNENWASKIYILAQGGTVKDWEDCRKNIPKDIIKMLKIRGLGAKKIKILWKEFNISSLKELYIWALEKKLSKVPGFGEKSQLNIIEEILFFQKNEHKLPYYKAEKIAKTLLNNLENIYEVEQVSISGQLRRLSPVIDKIQFVVVCSSFKVLEKNITPLENMVYQKEKSSPFAWRGYWAENQCPIEIKITQSKCFISDLFIDSADSDYLKKLQINDLSLLASVKNKYFKSEFDLYQSNSLAFTVPERREGFLLENKFKPKPKTLIQNKDLKGVLHVHSTYSDGEDSLKTMAKHCQKLGYQYLGITDHSVSAYYAGGLNSEQIKTQHREIDVLNKELFPFKIFKGIESDILMDGDLDYPSDILKTFDFVIASIHSPLDMDEAKATQRLLKAIQNPYTHILGHPTGRLLLKRKGYSIDFKKIIEACGEHHVVIEINANPLRLDLDWTWVPYALAKGVQLSINPDAHSLADVENMRYGVNIARKGGAEARTILNTLDKKEVETIFEK